jgi:D-amino-acid dehydrogenase
MKVIVLGAGVIGVTTAYFLARAGHEVVVLEKNSASALGCSYANGGQLSYSHIETWAAKTSFLSLIKAATLPGSFLSFSDFTNKNFWKWFREFYKNSSPVKAQENSRKLFRLSSYSKEILTQILDEEKDIQFDYKVGGILHFYRDQKKLDSAIKEAEFYNSIGCKAQIFSAEECIKKEPTLVKIFDEKKLAGGIFYEADASGDCMLFTKSLEKICREKYGVVFEYNAEVKNILTNYKKITGINSSKGVFTAHKYIYALGAYGNGLLRGVGIDPKIYPLKGYSLSIPADSEFMAPNIALTDSENKIVYSRFNNIFRAAGSVEISGLKNHKNQKMIRFLSKIIHATFSDFGNFNEVSDWFGFRPFRPNSIPLICEVKKYGNFLLNVGHGSLGWTLSTASGKIIADLVSDQKNKKFGFLEEEEEAIYKS